MGLFDLSIELFRLKELNQKKKKKEQKGPKEGGEKGKEKEEVREEGKGKGGEEEERRGSKWFTKEGKPTVRMLLYCRIVKAFFDIPPNAIGLCVCVWRLCASVYVFSSFSKKKKIQNNIIQYDTRIINRRSIFGCFRRNRSRIEFNWCLCFLASLTIFDEIIFIL